MKSHELAHLLLEKEDMRIVIPKRATISDVEEIKQVIVGSSYDAESERIWKTEDFFILNGETKYDYSVRIVVFKSRGFCSIIDFLERCNQKIAFLLIWLGRK